MPEKIVTVIPANPMLANTGGRLLPSEYGGRRTAKQL